MILKKCKFCNKNFYTLPYKIKEGKGKYCSTSCYHNTGVSDETKMKLSLRNKLKYTDKSQHPNFKGGKPKCLDCKKEIYYEATRCKSCEGKQRVKERSNFWKGGKSILLSRLKSLPEYRNWRQKVFERDVYICKECLDSTGGNLEAHHIKAFSIIMSEFLNYYNQFSSTEDKETLIKLAIAYEPFWDINNGQTLCKSCHELTNNFGAKILWKMN